MERQVHWHLCTQTLGEEGAAADLAAEQGAPFSNPRAHGEHHRIGLEFVSRCEPDAGNLVALRREAHHVSPHDFGAQFFRSLGHAESEFVGLHLSRGKGDAAHVVRVQRRKLLSQRIGVDPIGFDAAHFAHGAE